MFKGTGEQWGVGGLWVGDHACGHQTSAAPSGVELISSFPFTGDTGQISLISLFFLKACIYACACMYSHMHVCVCACVVTCVRVCTYSHVCSCVKTYPYVYLCVCECSCVCSHECSGLYVCVRTSNEPQQTLSRWCC